MLGFQGYTFVKCSLGPQQSILCTSCTYLTAISLALCQNPRFHRSPLAFPSIAQAYPGVNAAVQSYDREILEAVFWTSSWLLAFEPWLHLFLIFDRGQIGSFCALPKQDWTRYLVLHPSRCATLGSGSVSTDTMSGQSPQTCSSDLLRSTG